MLIEYLKERLRIAFHNNYFKNIVELGNMSAEALWNSYMCIYM